MSQRDAYIAKMKLQLDELNAKMGELEAKGKLAKDGALDRYKDEMDTLHRHSALAATKLEELKIAGEETWQALTDEAEKLRDAFAHSFKYFKSQL
jgi:predicted  nucleic acid-binding Zn-ribbon protein